MPLHSPQSIVNLLYLSKINKYLIIGASIGGIYVQIFFSSLFSVCVQCTLTSITKPPTVTAASDLYDSIRSSCLILCVCVCLHSRPYAIPRTYSRVLEQIVSIFILSSFICCVQAAYSMKIHLPTPRYISNIHIGIALSAK